MPNQTATHAGGDGEGGFTRTTVTSPSTSAYPAPLPTAPTATRLDKILILVEAHQTWQANHDARLNNVADLAQSSVATLASQVAALEEYRTEDRLTFETTHRKALELLESRHRNALSAVSADAVEWRTHVENWRNGLDQWRVATETSTEAIRERCVAELASAKLAAAKDVALARESMMLELAAMKTAHGREVNALVDSFSTECSELRSLMDVLTLEARAAVKEARDATKGVVEMCVAETASLRRRVAAAETAAVEATSQAAEAKSAAKEAAAAMVKQTEAASQGEAVKKIDCLH